MWSFTKKLFGSWLFPPLCYAAPSATSILDFSFLPPSLPRMSNTKVGNSQQQLHGLFFLSLTRRAIQHHSQESQSSASRLPFFGRVGKYIKKGRAPIGLFAPSPFQEKKRQKQRGQRQCLVGGGGLWFLPWARPILDGALLFPLFSFVTGKNKGITAKRPFVFLKMPQLFVAVLCQHKKWGGGGVFFLYPCCCWCCCCRKKEDSSGRRRVKLLLVTWRHLLYPVA